MNPLQDVRLYLLDMDGTFYLDDHLLPGALEFLSRVRRSGRRFMFLTNNSSKNRRDYLDKLAGLGAQVGEDELFTSADATLEYLDECAFPREMLLIGTPSLEEQFRARGYRIDAEEPKGVVLGFDTTITYEKLTKLCNAVRAGLPYIATHPDYNCPVQGGFIPDIGAVIAFVQARAAARRAGLSVEQLCMVGDRLYTDIALGQNCPIKTALVLCGETTPADAARSSIRPTVTADSLAGLLRYLD